jgi:hypothetical protein
MKEFCVQYTKRGETLKCNSYRPITLLNPLNAELNPIYHFLALLVAHHIHVSRIRVNSAYKMFKIVGRMSNRILSKEISVDICMIRKIFEKCSEYNIDLHNILVNYTKAFDSVYRNKIIEYVA